MGSFPSAASCLSRGLDLIGTEKDVGRQEPYSLKAMGLQKGGIALVLQAAT